MPPRLVIVFDPRNLLQGVSFLRRQESSLFVILSVAKNLQKLINHQSMSFRPMSAVGGWSGEIWLIIGIDILALLDV
jgi:hypothetical protein